MKVVTFREMESHAWEIVLASHACVEPDVHRQFVAKFRLGYYTEYVVRDHGRDVFKSENWREALIEYNHGDAAGTLGEAPSVPAGATSSETGAPASAPDRDRDVEPIFRGRESSSWQRDRQAIDRREVKR